jgi:predicted amidohydrolase
MMSSGRTITVAAGQLAARPMAMADQTLAAIDRLITRAAEERAELLVLPECAYPAYGIGSPQDYRSASILSSEEYISWLGERAGKCRLTIVSGLVERAGDVLFNGAVLIDARGRVAGRYRKTFLWDKDYEWFAPGERIEPVTTDLGVIGMAICADVRCPEVIATLAAAGADLIAVPTCWFNAPPEKGVHRNPQPEFLIEARSREFGVPFVCANKSGMENEAMGYCGRSLITLGDGSRLAEAPIDEEMLITARLSLARHRRVWMADRWERRLLSDRPPVSPSADHRSVTVAAVPSVVAQERSSGKMGEDLFGPLRKQGVNLAIINVPHSSVAEQVELLANAFDIRACAFPHTCDPVPTPHGTVGCIGARAARSFAAARCLAMDGAQFIAVFDAPEDLSLLRARALENRVFVLAVGERFAAIVSPGGDVLDCTPAGEAKECVATVDLALAADKNMAPNTHVWNGRRPHLYRFRSDREPWPGGL